jgi:hypothetical protein
MKRIFTLMVAALLLALALCPALAEVGKIFTTDYFTLTLPKDWEIDTSDLEKDGDFQELGTLYSPEVPGLVMEAGLMHYADMEDISLWNADEKTMQDYIDATLEDLKDDNPKYETTLNVNGIPFIVISAEDKDGPFRYIDTMTNGYAVAFYAYVANDDDDKLLPMSDDDWAQVESILATFKPAG